MTELEIEQLKEEIIRLKNELEKTKEHLNRYLEFPIFLRYFISF